MSVKREGTRYVVEFQLRGQRIHRRCPPGTTKAEAEALETKIRRDIFTTRDLGVESSIPLAGAIQTWLNERVKGSKSEYSRTRHALALAPYVGQKTLRELPAVADEYRLVSGLKPATINRRLAVLKAVAKYAWRKRIIGENLSARVWLLQENNARHVYLDAAEVWRLAGKAETPEGRAWIVLAAYTGLRRGELHGLEASQIRRKVIYLGTSKTGEPRLVPVARPAKPYLKFIPFERTVNSLEWEYRKTRKAAGFPHLHFHDLRHTTASLLANAGVDLYTIGKLLGQSATYTTARYTHLATKTLKAAMAKL